MSKENPRNEDLDPKQNKEQEYIGGDMPSPELEEKPPGRK